MELEKIVKGMPEQQRRYIIATALGAGVNAVKGLYPHMAGEPTINEWHLTDERFREAIELVGREDYIVDAIKLWVRDRALFYLQELDAMAMASGNGRVKLEALKHLLTIVGTDRKVIKQQLTAIEEYILGEGKKRITMQVTKEE